jgi:hypothetical protein
MALLKSDLIAHSYNLIQRRPLLWNKSCPSRLGGTRPRLKDGPRESTRGGDLPFDSQLIIIEKVNRKFSSFRGITMFNMIDS